MAKQLLKKETIKEEMKEFEKKEMGELRKIEKEVHYGTKELITGILIGIVIGFILAAVFL